MTPPTIAPYRHGYRAAVSFTFDDGCPSQARIVPGLFAAHGWRATIYVVAGWTDAPPAGVAVARWDEWRALAAAGFEIGSHSWSHPRLNAGEDPAQLHREIVTSGDRIREATGQGAITFAFPYNVWNSPALALARQHYAGVREQWTDYSRPDHTLAEVNARVERVIAKGNWLIPCLHGVEEGYGPVTREFLRAHLAFIGERAAELWVDTFANIRRYQLTREQTILEPLTASRWRVSCSRPEPVPVTLELPGAAPVSVWRCRADGRDRVEVTGRGGRRFCEVLPGCELEFE